MEKKYIDTAEPLEVGGTVTIKYSKKGKVYEGIYLGTTHEAVKKYEDNENTDNQATRLSSARLEAQEEHNKPSTSFASARSVSKENKLEKQRKGKKPIKEKSKKEGEFIEAYPPIQVSSGEDDDDDNESSYSITLGETDGSVKTMIKAIESLDKKMDIFGEKVDSLYSHTMTDKPPLSPSLKSLQMSPFSHLFSSPKTHLPSTPHKLRLNQMDRQYFILLEAIHMRYQVIIINHTFNKIHLPDSIWRLSDACPYHPY